MKGDLNYISSSIFVLSYHNMCWNEKRDGLNFLTWFGFWHIFGACLWAWFSSGKNCMYSEVILESKFFISQSQNKSLNEDLIIVNNYIQKSNFYFNIKIFACFLHFFQSPKNDVVQFIFWVSIKTQELQSKFRVWFWPNTAQMKNVFLIICNIALP